MKGWTVFILGFPKMKKVMCIKRTGSNRNQSLHVMTKGHFTSRADFHPGEGDSSNDTFTEAQQERAPLLLLQKRLLFALVHKTHDESGFT